MAGMFRRSATTRLLVALLALALGACLGSLPAAAQQPSTNVGEVRLFDEPQVMIRAATKTDVPLSKVPGSVTVISAQQIRESGARTIPEALRLVAGLNVRWNPMVQSIDVRGFGQSPFTARVLLLIDGVPYNAWDKGGFPQHPSFDFFVLQNVKRLEVVRGAGSSLYGENAYWGVINIVTLSGEDLDGGRIEAFGGERDTASGSVMYGKKKGDTSYLVSAKYLRSQLPTALWFEVSDSHVKGADVFAKFQRKGLQLSYYLHDDKVEGFSEPLPDPALPPGTVFKSADEVSQTVQIAALKYDHAPQGAPVTVGLDVAWEHRVGTHCAACHAARQKPEFGERADHGYQLIGDFRVGIRSIKHNDLLLGVEARRVAAGDHRDELDVTAGDPYTDEYSKVAVYAQDQISLGDKATLTAGVRYDGSTAIFDDKFSPRVALVVSPTERLVLRGGYSSAFRFPNFSELYQNSWFLSADVGPFAIPLVVFQPNGLLKPEQIQTFDAGAEVRLSDNVSAKLDLYHSRVKDFMVITALLAPPPAPAAFRVENHPDEATIQGAEVELRWNVSKRFSGFVNYSYQKEEQQGSLRDSGGLPFEFVYAPKNKFNVAAYVGPFGGVRGSLELAWKDEYVGPFIYYLVRSGFTDPTIRPQPSYTLVNARLNWDLPIDFGGKQRPLRLSLYGKNLLDERPFETFVGVDSRIAGREFFGGLTVVF